MPDTFCETEGGVVLVANGMDRMLRWDGLRLQAQPAGLTPPASAVSFSGTGQGQIVGDYYAYLRFVDADGNYSNLSPVSDLVTVKFSTGSVLSVTVYDLAAIDALAQTGASGATLAGLANLIESPVQIKSTANHSLNSGTFVTIEGAGGFTDINGTYEIVVDGSDTFRLKDLKASASYTGGGTWTSGAASVVYTAVAIPTEPRIRRRQILRNTRGQARTFYVDVDTANLAATTFTSSLNDEDLSAQEAVPLLDTDGRPLADRFTVPPNHKAVVAVHLGRVFAAVDVVYIEGCVAVTLGSLAVQGVGTEWTSEMADRFLYVDGASQSYQIDSVDEDTQIATLTGLYQDSTDPYARYGIRPAPGESRLVYYTEAGLPEAWPATNALSVPEDSDVITGLAVSNSFIYILERRHIHRFTFQSDPAVDGYIFLNSDGRGCLNQRCWTSVEGSLYMMDEQGIFKFDGSADIQPISNPIQDFFRNREGRYAINWSAGAFFHCVNYSQQETVRWFVALSGDYLPRHALCFNYKLGRWWLEEFNTAVGSSCVSVLNGQPVVLLGCEAHRVVKLWEGTLDGVRADAGTVRGTATSAELLSLTDSQAAFPPNLAGVPVAIIDGTGRGQIRSIISNTATVLAIKEPWLKLPDTTSVYQVGAVSWRFLSGFYRFVPDENQNPRRLEVIFDPLANPALMNVRIFRDFSKRAKIFKTPYSLSAGGGVKSEDGVDALQMDLTDESGYLQKSFSGHKETRAKGTRYWAFELGGYTNADPVVIGDAALEGAKEPG